MATFFTIYIRDFRPFSPVLGPTFITDGGGSSLIAELNTTIEDDKKRKRQKHMHLNNLMRLGQFSFLLVGIKHHMYSCYVSDETGERKRTTRKINDQLEKCRWVESAHLSLSLAGSYVAERKANQRKAKLGFIFPVSFTLFLCHSPLSTKFPSFSVQKILSFYLGLWLRSLPLDLLPVPNFYTSVFAAFDTCE